MDISVQIHNDLHIFQCAQTDQRVAEALCELRSALKVVQGLRCPMDETHLLKFLRAKKLNVKEALKLILNYYLLKKENPGIIFSISPYELKAQFMKSKSIIVLKNRDSLGRKIVFVRFRLWDPSEVCFDRALMSTLYLLEEILISEETQNNGLVYINDYTGIGLNHSRKLLAEMSLARTRMIVRFLQGSCPARFKEFHVLDTHYIFKLVFSISKPFLSEKIKKRVYTHSNVKSLLKMMNSNILPQCLGGTLSENDAEDHELMNSLYSKAAHYKKMLSYGYCDGMDDS